MINYPSSLQQNVEAAIVAEMLAVGSVISAETIANSYAASTADSATVLAAAHYKGLLQSIGDGHFRVLGKPPASIKSVFQHGKQHNLNPTSVVRSLEVVAADNADAATLGVTLGELVYKQKRTRLISGEIVANQCNTIPFHICPTLGEIDLSQRSFQETLDEEFNTVVSRIEERCVLGAANEEDAAVLGLPHNSILLDARRLSYSRNDCVLVSAELHIRIDRYHYVAALWPQAAALLQIEADPIYD